MVLQTAATLAARRVTRFANASITSGFMSGSVFERHGADSAGATVAFCCHSQLTCRTTDRGWRPCPRREERRREQPLGEPRQRIRDVRQGPDGLLYLLTDETPGALLRIEPF